MADFATVTLVGVTFAVMALVGLALVVTVVLVGAAFATVVCLITDFFAVDATLDEATVSLALGSAIFLTAGLLALTDIAFAFEVCVLGADDLAELSFAVFAVCDVLALG